MKSLSGCINTVRAKYYFFSFLFADGMDMVCLVKGDSLCYFSAVNRATKNVHNVNLLNLPTGTISSSAGLRLLNKPHFSQIFCDRGPTKCCGKDLKLVINK